WGRPWRGPRWRSRGGAVRNERSCYFWTGGSRPSGSPSGSAAPCALVRVAPPAPELVRSRGALVNDPGGGDEPLECGACARVAVAIAQQALAVHRAEHERVELERQLLRLDVDADVARVDGHPHAARERGEQVALQRNQRVPRPPLVVVELR